jgi:hypothetical protein
MHNVYRDTNQSCMHTKQRVGYESACIHLENKAGLDVVSTTNRQSRSGNVLMMYSLDFLISCISICMSLFVCVCVCMVHMFIVSLNVDHYQSL